MLQYSYDNPDSFMGVELKETIKALEAIIKTESPWGRVLNDVKKNFAWDFEEATAIRIMQNKDQYYSEVWDFVKSKYDVEDELLKEVFEFNKCAVLDPNVTYPIKQKFNYNIYNVIRDKVKLEKKQTEYQFDADNYNGDLYEWGKEKLWWGRRVAACKTKITNLKKADFKMPKIIHHRGTLRNQ